MTNYKTKMICTDIDGTLIDNGISAGYFPELKKGIISARRKGIIFSMASGRDYEFMGEFWNRLTDSLKMREEEALLYEDACLFLGDGRRYVLGGLDEPTLKLIKEIELQYPLAFDGLIGLPNQFTIKTSRVTKEFAMGQKTQGIVREKLEKRYAEINALFEGLKKSPNYTSLLWNLSIRMSADAIDFIDKRTNKGLLLIGIKRY